MDAKQRQELRFRYLQALYELTGGDESEYISDAEVIAKLDAEREEIEKAIKYLEKEKLISYTTGRRVKFTHQGVREVEAKLVNPVQATAHFPQIVNILKVDQISNSEIQQGTVASAQTPLHGNASPQAHQPPKTEKAFTGGVTVTDQTRCLRADRVSEADMQALTMANGKLVDFQGRFALLVLDTSIQLGGKASNVVELYFDQTAYKARADRDYSEVLGRLPFYEP